MKSMKSKILCAVLAASLMAAVVPTPVFGISPKKEEELAREFMQLVKKEFTLIQDPMIVDYVNKVGRKIVAVLPVQPFPFKFHVIQSDVYNAFAIPAGNIFINSSLLMAMESEDELAGILGHEIAHVVSRHISDKIQRSKTITAATLAGMIAGAFLGSGGAGDAAQAVTAGAMAAGQSVALAYSRADERQADQLGLKYLAQAGYSARGLLSVMKKIRSRQWWNGNEFPDYLSTHPGTEERMATIGSWIAQNAGKPSASDVKPSYAFARTRARLLAVYGDQAAATRHFAAAVDQNPQDAVSQYGYGLVLTRQGKLDEAVVHLRAALEKRAFDPYILNDLGRAYYLDGRYAEALRSLEGTVSISAENDEALFLLGRTHMELDNLENAAAALEQLVSRRPEYPEAAFFLGKTYGRLGRLDRAHYFLGLHYRGIGDLENTQFHLQKARQLTDNPQTGEEIEKILREVQKETDEGSA